MRCLILCLAVFIFGLVFYSGGFSNWLLNSEKQKVVAFSFDDGPRPQFLEKLLPFLKKEKIPATFFVIGQIASQYPECLKREIREGHEIENHTYSHPLLTKRSLNSAISDVKKGAEIIEKITGIRPKFLRPPYFAINSRLVSELKKIGCHALIHGRNSIGSLDWVYVKNPEKIIIQVCGEAKKRGDLNYVIVFHENMATLKALPEIINFFRARNYQFVCLDDLARIDSRAEI